MNPVDILIWIHAGFGGIALLSGVGALSFKKGSKNHVISGKTFYYAMAVSAMVALLIAVLPGHTSPFLFMLGIFSLYLIIGGKRAVRFKKIDENTSLSFDLTLAVIMIISAVGTVVWILFNSGPLLLTGIFGGLGSVLAIRDLKNSKKRENLKKGWIKIHLGKMIGGYIAATTAFIVVNQFIPNIWGWLAPSIIGSTFITYWMVKLSPKGKS